MSKQNVNESKVIENYLQKLKNCKFLSKKEEQVIGRRIKNVELQILDECLKYQIFRDELLKLKPIVERNISNVTKYSKELIEDSPANLKEGVRSKFLTLFDSIQWNDQKTMRSIIKDINFTSSLINQLITSMKDLHGTVMEYKDKTNKVYRFLEVNNEDEYNDLVMKCRDLDFRRSLARKLYTQQATLVKYLTAQEDIMAFYNKNKLNEDKVQQIQELMKNLLKLEADYKADREQLIKANLPLVISRATRFSKSNMDLEDLIQEGNIGLIKAVDKYDPDRNVKITTYATWWIDQAIRRSISNKSRLVRVPIHIQANLKLINQAYFILSQEYKREPTLKEIAAHTKIPLKTIEELNKTALHEVGIDTEMSSGISYSDVLFDKEQKTPFAEAVENLSKDRIRLAISQLQPRLQKIIMLYFGIGMVQEHTLEEIGVKFDLTKERIRQLKKAGLNKIKDSKTIPEES